MDTRQLIEIIEENSTGIEKAVRHSSSKDDKEDEEQEEYVKDCSYESENSYVQKNPYAPKKDYERIEHIKPKEEEEFEIKADNLENLMLNWLQALIAIVDTEQKFFSKFDIEIEFRNIVDTTNINKIVVIVYSNRKIMIIVNYWRVK